MADFNALQAVIARHFKNAKLFGAASLTGGSSATILRLDVLHHGKETAYILRSFEPATPAARAIVANEYKTHKLLHKHGLPVPQPLCYDDSGTILPDPYFIMEFAKGTNGVDYTPHEPEKMAKEMACTLTKIHHHPVDVFDFLPRQTSLADHSFAALPQDTDETINERNIRINLQKHCPLPPKNQAVLLHGDYWPGNILWNNNKITALLDWEDAATGDPLADVASARLELLWQFGEDIANSFTRNYLQQNNMDPAHLPLWDLRACVIPAFKLDNWVQDTKKALRMKNQLKNFAKTAINNLPQI